MPHVRNRRAVLMLAVLLLGVGLSACSDDDEDAASSRTTTTVPESGSGEEDAEVNAVAIDMTEYKYGIAGDLQAGTSTVTIKNSGTEVHMAAFALLKEGKTLTDVQTALQSGDDAAFDAVVARRLDSPGSILSPGQSEELTTDFLVAGSYAVMCFIPTAGEATSIPHLAKGMLGTFDVAPGAVEATEVQADAEYTIDDGSIDGPKTLKAGENKIRMTSSGKGPHELFVAKKASKTTTYDDIDGFFSNLFESDTAPPKGYADTAPGILAATTFDVVSGKSIVVTTDLEPGDYLIGCAHEDDEEGGDGKRHTGEIIEVTVA
ncbi:MAG TPA: hypothetical protein VHM89_07740 [Acidimicrobiales bacterium]|nr:hypothetical protein [Acidimicrobiales bacterium]